MSQKNISRRQAGFTMIEIIAVLVILGVLAAVAVPRFMNMQQEAQIRSLEQAFSAASSNVSASYAQYILRSNGAQPTGIAGNAFTPATTPATPAIPVALGDFTASYAWVAGGSYTVNITAGPAWFAALPAANKTRNFIAPWQ